MLRDLSLDGDGDGDGDRALLVLMMRVRLALLLMRMLLDASCRNNASAHGCLGHHDGRNLNVFARHCFMLS